MTQLHGPRSGDLVRTRRRDGLPAGSPELRLHRDHGLEHGREPPGRVPVGDGGQGARGAGDPRRPALHAHERDGDEVGRHPRRQRHRVPRRDRQLHPRARPLLRGVRQALHERARDHRRGRSATPRTSTASSRAGIPSEGKYDTTTWQYAGMEAHGARRPARGARDERRAVRPRRPRRRAPARRAARGGPDAPAPALRLPAAEAALPPLHARARRRDVRLHRRGLPRRRRGALRQLGPASGRRRSATRSAGRSTRSASSTSAPRRSSSSCSATWAAPAAGSWRCAGTRRSRARPTSRRSTTSCPATCRCRTPSTYGGLEDFVEANTAPTGWWGHFDAYCDQPDEGLLRRARDAPTTTGCFELAAAHRRRQLAPTRRRSTCSTARSRATSSPARTRRSATRNCEAAPARAREARLARRARPRRDRVGVLLVRQPGDRVRRARDGGDPDRGLLPAGRRAHREGRLLHEHAAPAAVAPSGGRAEGRLPLRALVLLPPRPACCKQKLAGLRGAARRAVLEPDAGTTRRTAQHRGAERRGGARRDQRPRDPTASRSRRLPEAEGRRLDRLRLLDLLRRLRRRRQPGGAQEAALGAGDAASRPSGAGPGRPTGGSSTTAPRPTPTASRGRSASATSGGTPTQEKWTGDDVPDFEADKPPDYVPPDGAEAEDAIARRPPVHHAGRRARLALRPAGARGRAAADALRAARVAVRQPALRASGRTRRRQQYDRPDEPVQPAPASRASTRTSSRPTG